MVDITPTSTVSQVPEVQNGKNWKTILRPLIIHSSFLSLSILWTPITQTKTFTDRGTTNVIHSLTEFTSEAYYNTIHRILHSNIVKFKKIIIKIKRERAPKWIKYTTILRRTKTKTNGR